MSDAPHHAGHAGHFLRLRGVDGADAGMGAGAAQHSQFQRPLQFDVGREMGGPQALGMADGRGWETPMMRPVRPGRTASRRGLAAQKPARQLTASMIFL